jgi:hypothetical protein
MKNMNVQFDLTILTFEVRSPLEILIMWDSFEALIVYAGHLGIEILEQRFHGAIENSQYLFRFI